MKRLILIAIPVLLILSGFTRAQENKEGNEPKFELATYYFVMLINGPNRTQSDSIAQKIQAGHMANINKMADEGKLVCAGPFADNKGGGIFILKVATEEEAKKLIDSDPAVIAGRLVYEVRPWVTAKGTFKNEK